MDFLLWLSFRPKRTSLEYFILWLSHLEIENWLLLKIQQYPF